MAQKVTIITHFSMETPKSADPDRMPQNTEICINIAILSLPLIQDGQLSVSGERMCKILVKRLGLSLPSKGVVR